MESKRWRFVWFVAKLVGSVTSGALGVIGLGGVSDDLRTWSGWLVQLRDGGWLWIVGAVVLFVAVNFGPMVYRAIRRRLRRQIVPSIEEMGREWKGAPVLLFMRSVGAMSSELVEAVNAKDVMKVNHVANRITHIQLPLSVKNLLGSAVYRRFMTNQKTITENNDDPGQIVYLCLNSAVELAAAEMSKIGVDFSGWMGQMIDEAERKANKS
jgi:hypothetical protein